MRIIEDHNRSFVLKIEKALLRRGHLLFKTGTYNLNIIGIRSRENKPDVFDDVLCLIYKNEFGDLMVDIFECTTDPGLFWLRKPLNVKGTAILKEGQYRSAYKLGKHKGKTALVQVQIVEVYRDRNRDGTFDMMNTEKGLFGINIHRAIDNKIADVTKRVGKWSAGCTVIADIDKFKYFMRICKRAAKKYGNRFTYTLINEEEIK